MSSHPSTSAPGTVAVTGPTGGLGSRVTRRLEALGITLRLVARDPERASGDLSRLTASAGDGTVTVVAGSFGDGTAMRAAFTGADAVFLVSGSEDADRVQQHFTAVDAAVAAGVRHLVYTSYLGASPDATFVLARDHYFTEEHIKASGLGYTFLRDSLYLDFLPVMLWEDQAIRGPGGDGRVACVSRDDVADVAVAVLTGVGSDSATSPGPAHVGATYTLTGPVALTLEEIAAIMARHSGRPITYQQESVEQARASRAAYGAPDWMVDGWVSMYTSIAAGRMDLVTDHVEKVTGHPAQTLQDYLAAYPLAASSSDSR
jgi:NAD(P)H dehydrogenase (quinone)